jgi:hypothetical protein
MSRQKLADAGFGHGMHKESPGEFVPLQRRLDCGRLCRGRKIPVLEAAFKDRFHHIYMADGQLHGGLLQHLLSPELAPQRLGPSGRSVGTVACFCATLRVPQGMQAIVGNGVWCGNDGSSLSADKKPLLTDAGRRHPHSRRALR